VLFEASSAREGPEPTSATCSRLPTEPDQELVRVGRVGRPHGVDGAFVVDDASEDPTRFEVGAQLLVDGQPARVLLARQVGGRRHAIKLDRAVVRGAELAIRRNDLPELPADTYYVADLMGMSVLDETGRQVGVVCDVLPGPANDVLELDTGLLLPLVEACVRDVDLHARRVLLNPGFIG
jgi:16S rRNA processing protein RimM